MNNQSIPILHCFTPERWDHPWATAIDPSHGSVAALIAGELYIPSWRMDFYNLLKKVQDSADPQAEEDWYGNESGYILKKESVTVLSLGGEPVIYEEKITVPLPLFLQALHEWEEYLKKDFPEFIPTPPPPPPSSAASDPART